MNEVLMRFEPRNIREIIESQSIRIEKQYLFERLLKRLPGLQGQAVDKIDIDTFESQLPAPCDHLPGDLLGLNTIDRPLDFFIHILYTDACALKPSIGKRLNMVARNFTGIDLNADLGIIGNMKISMNGFAEFSYLRRQQMRRCASAPM